MAKWSGWVVAVAFVVIAIFASLASNKHAAELAEAVRIAEEQEAIAVAFARQQTENLYRERAKTRQAEQALLAERERSILSLQSADSAVADAHQVLQDSSSTNVTLRTSLMMTVNNLDSLSGQFRAYIARTDSLLYRVAVERDAADSALASEKRAHDATKGARDALRREMQARQCKVWFVSCPSRKTSFLAGGAVVAYFWLR